MLREVVLFVAINFLRFQAKARPLFAATNAQPQASGDQKTIATKPDTPKSAAHLQCTLLTTQGFLSATIGAAKYAT